MSKLLQHQGVLTKLKLHSSNPIIAQ